MRAHNFPHVAFLFAAICSGLAGCASTPREPIVTAEHYYVPTAALIHRPGSPINPANVLACGADEVVYGRDEKAIYGAVPVAGVSAFTIYTFDAQRISSDQGSSGYRYRWVVQQGISAPQAP